MSPDAIEALYQSFYLIFMLSMPPIAVASVVGILFSLFQAITQLQEQTLSFGVKLIAVCITMFLTAGWFSEELIRFSDNIFNNFYNF